MSEDHSLTADPERKTRAFICYSRADRHFADQLVAALAEQGIEALIDRSAIRPGEPSWQARRDELIVQSDAVVFVISPDAARSEECNREVVVAASLNKRFVAIVWRSVPTSQVPKEINVPNWIFLTEPERFAARVEDLTTALKTDFGWIRKHTEFGEHARRWDLADRPRPSGLMLRPPLLKEAEGWLRSHRVGWLEPTAAIRAFVAESRTVFDQENAAVLASQLNLLTQVAESERFRGNFDAALKLCVHAVRRDPDTLHSDAGVSRAAVTLTSVVSRSRWDLLLGGHEDTVCSAEFGPKGSHIVTASYDKTARIWDATTGKELMVFRGHHSVISSAAFSPDGLHVVTASWDRTGRIWNAATGAVILVLGGHGHAVSSAAFSPDGSRVVTSSWDGTARIWDTATGREIARLVHRNGHVFSANFSFDGSRIITTSHDNAARIWDVATGQQISVLHDTNRSPLFNPYGSRGNCLRSATFSRDGTHVVTASDDKTAHIWNTTSEQEVRILRGHEGPVSSAAFSPDPDGRCIVTASDDKTMRVWNAKTGETMSVLGGHGARLLSVAFSPDGSRIVSASSDKSARIWVSVAGERNIVLSHGGAVISAAFSADGSRIATASDDTCVRIWDAPTGSMIKELWVGYGCRSVAFGIDGGHIIVTHSDASGCAWDLATGRKTESFNGQRDAVSSASFSPDKSRNVTMRADRTARVCEVATGKEIAVIRGHEDEVSSASFSSDGSRIVTASVDCTARIWDAATGKEIIVLRGHLKTVAFATFSPDGSRVVTTSYDETARIWDTSLVTKPTRDLLVEVCTRRLRNFSKLDREQMSLAGYSDDVLEIDVCAGIE